MTPRGVYRQSCWNYCMVALNNGSRRTQNNMASKIPEAVKKKSEILGKPWGGRDVESRVYDPATHPENKKYS